MKRYVGLVVMAVAVVVAAGMGYRGLSRGAQEARREADFARLQRDYLERVGWMRANPDEKAYREELGPFFKWYFAQVDAHLQRHGGNPRFDTYLAELDKRAARKEGEAGVPERRAFYASVRQVFDALRGGTYAPLWTGTHHGLRLDVASAQVVQVLGRPQVRLQLVLWGAGREVREEGRLKKMVTHASFSTLWKLTDAQGRFVAEMSASDPSMRVDFPERFIPEFPPQMVLGHYDLDLVPANVARMDVTFNVSSRSPTGGPFQASWAWRLDVPAGWKLGAGEKWEGAVETERSEEEIDPSKVSQRD